MKIWEVMERIFIIIVSLFLYVNYIADEAQAVRVYEDGAIRDKACCHRMHKGENMNSSDGFFNPSVRVCRHDGSIAKLHKPCKAISLYGDSCRYVFPANVKVYLEAQYKTDEDGLRYDIGRPQICAYTVLNCNPKILAGFLSALAGIAAAVIAVAATLFTVVTLGVGGAVLGASLAGSAIGAGVGVGTTVNSGIDAEKLNKIQKVGCFDIPLAPGPPPFCDSFQRIPELKVRPVQYKVFDDDPEGVLISTIKSPKVKIVLGDGVKICADGSRTRITSECEDGSIGHTTDKSRILEVPIGEGRPINMEHSGYKYEVFTKYSPEVEEICVHYKLLNYEDFDEPHVICIPAPGIPKPVVSMISGAKLSNPTIGVSFPEIGDDQVRVVSQGNPLSLFNDNLVLKLFRATVDNNREFKADYKCTDGKDVQEDGTCKNEEAEVDTKYIDNKFGRVACLIGYFAGDFYTRDNNDFVRLKEGGRFYYLHDNFIDKEALAEGRVPISKLVVDIHNMKQAQLDTVGFLNGTVDEFGMYINGEFLKYKILEGSYIPFVNEPEEGVEYSRIELKDDAGVIYLAHTKFNDEHNRAFFISKKHKVTALDPYNANMCVIYGQEPVNRGLKFDNHLYTHDDGGHYVTDLNSLQNKRQCDFLTIETWGGGASGYIYGEGAEDEDITRNGNSFSGASGGYVKKYNKN